MTKSPHSPAEGGPLYRKILWFIGLWAASVLTITVLGGLIRMVLL